MKIDESKVENVGIILVVVGIFLVFVGIDGPLIAGSILCGAVLISKSFNPNQIDEESDQTENPYPVERTKCDPDDADNPFNPPENSKNQQDD